MNLAKIDYIEWYVVFTRTDSKHYIYRWVDREIGHVYAVKSLNDYFWLVIDPRINVTHARTVLKSQYPFIYDLIGSEDKVIKVRSNPAPRDRNLPCWFNCVEQVKALLGIRSFWTITPKQLFRYLGGING